METLFPRFLDGPHGAVHSKGAAVQHLIGIMFSIAEHAGLDVSRLERDDDYGPALADVIGQFQDACEVERDGNFGPGTQAALSDGLHIDVRKIPAAVGEITHWLGPDSDELGIWPLRAASGDREDANSVAV